MRAYNVDAVRAGLLALAFLAVCGAAAAEVRNPDGVAVIIGNKDYGDRDVPPVAYAHRDAGAFKRYVLDVLGYAPGNVFELRDADRAAMLKALGRRGGKMSDLWAVLARLPEGGDVVVYYSGHGVPGREGGMGYLLPVNVAPRAAEADGYPLDLLYEQLGSLGKARSVRVFLDACFSGGSHAGSLVQDASPVAMSAAMPAEASDKVTVLTAAEGSQLASWDEDSEHGLFTHHLLDALYGKGDRDRDGRVTAAEARAYLDAHMSSAAWLSHGREQRAVLLKAGEVEVVLASAGDGGFPARPVLGPVGETEEAGAARVRAEEAHVSPEKLEKGLGLSAGDRRLAQMGLAAAGHDPGPADGVFGRRTRAALRAWQASKDLEVTGYLTEEQSEGLTALGREEPERRAREERQRTKAVEPDGKGAVSGADTPGGAVSGGAGGPVRDALHRAAEAGDFVGLQAALAAGADVDARDGRGWTALMHAVAKGYPVLAGLLLEAEASPDVRAPDGATALFMAAADGHTENVMLLMEAGADVSFRGPGSRTAVDVARERYGDAETARRGGEPAAVLALLEGMSLDAFEAALDDAAFARAEAAGTMAAFEGYLSSYPKGRHAKEAADAVGRLRAEAERKERVDDAAFARAEAAGTMAAFEGYLSSYPKGRHAKEAADAVERLRAEAERKKRADDDAAFARAKAAGTLAAFEGYLSSYPEGRHAKEAADAVKRLRAEAERKKRADDDAAFALATTLGTLAAFEGYLSSYPKGRHAKEAADAVGRLRAEAERKERADDAAFARAKAVGTMAAFEGYLSSYPKGRHAKEAADAARRLRAEAERKERADDDAAFARAKAVGTVLAFEFYLTYYPKGRHAKDAADAVTRRAEAERKKRADDDAAFARAKAAGTAAAYAGYRSSYPEGRHVKAAERREEERRAGRQFRDCVRCPEMVVVPPGTYMMGSSWWEAGWFDDEVPMHWVKIAHPFAVGVYEVTRGEFGRFVSATGRSMGNSCWTHEDGEWEKRAGKSWRNPGFRQTEAHPVVCVSWDDAKAYVGWLSKKTGKEYRLLSESEWEYVARAGTKTPCYWGESVWSQCRYANGADEASGDFGWGKAPCDDGYARTSPVGTFSPNRWKLRDVLGNVWEWVEDCWNGSYHGAPTDGSAWESGDCGVRVMRGGSWGSGPRYLRSANRGWTTTGFRPYRVGFRVARTLTP